MNLDSQDYLVDPGFGNRSYRYPLPVTFDKPGEQIITQLENEKFAFELKEDKYYEFGVLFDGVYFGGCGFPKESLHGNTTETMERRS